MFVYMCVSPPASHQCKNAGLASVDFWAKFDATFFLFSPCCHIASSFGAQQESYARVLCNVHLLTHYKQLHRLHTTITKEEGDNTTVSPERRKKC